MATLIQVTKMESGLPVLVSLYGVKMIEDTTYTPKKVVAPPPAEGKAPVTTQTVTTAPPVVDVPPVVCSLIYFHDDKTLVVKESMSAIVALVAISNT